MSPSPDDEKTEVRLDSGSENPFPCLEIVSGPKGHGRFQLKSGKNQIGRSDDNDIVLDDSSVSRRHAMLEVGGEGAFITDLGSRNGTKVANRKIDQPTPLSHDSRIKIGLYQLRYLTRPEGAVVAKDEAEEPAESVGELPSTKAPFGEVSEEIRDDLAPLPEELSPSAPARTRKWILYAGLVVALIVAGVFGGPKVMKIFSGKKTVQKKIERKNKPASVLPAEATPTPAPAPGVQPVFLEFSATPIPAQIYFGNDPVGGTPLRISTNLTQGKWYEARGLFQLPEIGETVEEKVQFQFPVGGAVIPVNFVAKIGVFKVTSLPRNTQLYLEGYFESDPYRAKPIKFAEIVFGKPIYLPYGRYVMELRKSRQMGQSQTYLDEVIYRREFYISPQQTNYTVDVNEEALMLFPVQIASVPPGATVLIDDKEVGATPYSGAFPVGDHLLTLKKEGYFDFVQPIKMQINMPYVAEIPLKTSEAGEFINNAVALVNEGRYTEALPVLVEAFQKNPTPRETAQISYMVGTCYLNQKSYKEAQDYFLKAMAHDDFKYASRLGIATLTLDQGDSIKALQILVEVLISSSDPKVRADAATLFQKISPLKSVLYIASEPSGAKVLVNGTAVGQITPMILHDLAVGAYRIQIRKDGYQEIEMKLNLGVSEFRPVVAQLKRTGAPLPETRKAETRRAETRRAETQKSETQSTELQKMQKIKAETRQFLESQPAGRGPGL
jgi:pSer/pThr/pTyr-binding forkhead associated (FHA) protein/tetratricopeptide (TPR) repeat protein